MRKRKNIVRILEPIEKHCGTCGNRECIDSFSEKFIQCHSGTKYPYWKKRGGKK